MKKDYFAILGLSPSASEKEIRSAYKRLARKHHPDMNPGNKQAEEKFKEISEAYAVLSDPGKRRKWERGETLDFESIFGGAGRGGPGDPFVGFGFEKIFEDLLGGPRGRARASSPERGADLQYEASLGFEEAIRGTSLEIPLARTVACVACSGRGFRSLGSPAACPACGGRGQRAMGQGPFRIATTCPECGGSGQTPGESCPTCGGSGARRVSETIQVRIPAGVADGGRVRVSGKGEGGRRGRPAGDLYVVLHVRPHAYFRREGRDIVLDLPLTIAEAALGAKIEVPTIAGPVTLTVPQGSASGQRLRLKGRGVPAPRGGVAGDQIAMLQIVTPTRLDPETRRHLEELGRLDPSDPRSGLGW